MAAGISTILVLTGLGMEALRAFQNQAVRPFRITMNLKHAVEVILKGMHNYSGSLTSLERACYALLDEHVSFNSLHPLHEELAWLARNRRVKNERLHVVAIGQQAQKDGQWFERVRVTYEDQLALRTRERDVQAVGVCQVLAQLAPGFRRGRRRERQDHDRAFAPLKTVNGIHTERR